MQALTVAAAGVRCPGIAAQRRLQRTAAHVVPLPRVAAAPPQPQLRRAPAHARAVASRAVSVRAAAADGAASPGALYVASCLRPCAHAALPRAQP
jgi:hypothetical protein